MSNTNHAAKIIHHMTGDLQRAHDDAYPHFKIS